MLLAVQMGSYDHVMPGVDANKMVASENPVQGWLLSANGNSVHKTTSDGILHNENNSTRNNAHNNSSNAGRQRVKPRSVSESECENYSRSFLPRLNRKDETNNCKMPTVDSPDLEPLNEEDLDGLPLPNEVKLPVPPDGGWGWVIVAVSFVCCAVVDGLCSVFGVLLPELVIYFQETSSKVSLAGSVLAGGFLLSGNLLNILQVFLKCCLRRSFLIFVDQLASPVVI